MIINLEKIRPKTRREPSAQALDKLKKHYAGVMQKYGYDTRSSKAFDKLAEYFARYYAGTKYLHEGAEDSAQSNEIFDLPERGLLLFGPCGTGKTYAMQIFSGLFSIEIIYADELAQAYGIGGEKQFWDYVALFDNKPLIVDDIASEREIKSYGNESIMIDFIYRRERRFKYAGVLTFFTSNVINRKGLVERYGDRAVSRMLGMTDQILLTGTDGRLIRKS
jgi:hypothetical protein